MNKEYSILIGGEAGQGSRKAGFIIAKLFSEYGYRIFIYDDYQSLIKGGHNFSNIRASKEKILSHKSKSDFLLALDQRTISEHEKDLTKNGIIIYDSKKYFLNLKNKRGIPVQKTVEELGGIPIMRNVAIIAGFAKVVGIKWQVLEKVLKKEIKRSQDLNLKIAKIIFDETKNDFKIEKLKQKPFPLINGNHAIALGAAKAGLDLYIAYPMTPASGILHYLAKNKESLGIDVAHLENEISVANAAIGAICSGARTMVGTSGGGFALMTEALSLAVQNESALVIVESQRMSPASGVPTYTAQGDLLFTLFAGHGDILKFVIAPGDAEEAFLWSGKILNLSWKYQTPSILLVDKEISESTFSFDKSVLNEVEKEEPIMWDKQGEYKRYKITKNGISPIAFMGERNAVVKINSYEHDEFGITIDDIDGIEKMQDKRLRKFEGMKKEVEKLKAVNVFGNKNSKKAIVVWGSTKGPAKEVAEKLGIKMIQPIVIQPFPEKQMKKALKGVEKLILFETNATGQMEKVLNSYGIKVDKKVLKYNARPFFPEEIEKHINT
ncbi:MAG: 2-oxoacid:acceptor oxidoreductase subunit alpha [Patescibacteria group bacterium]|nr:2-oxoacid:acceptor oxidoreductase subunit alpha [Patescibacteria group bacterium]